MKKFLFILILTALCAAQLASCNSVDLPMDNSGDSQSAASTDISNESTNVSDTASEDNSAYVSELPSDNSNGSSADIIIDTSSADDTPSAVVKYITTDDYSYAVSLSDAEKNAINAGANGEFMILVNKQNKLPDDYAPENLVDVRNTRKDRAPGKMVETAEIALHAFLNEAAYYGYGDVTVTSAYRSVAYQRSLFYDVYVAQEMAKGKDRESAIAAASVYSAFPGTSEHHTGLCVDMHNLSAASQTFGSTPAAKWLAENAHRFGFILRFPQGKDSVTGYMWEPWHFRFVGIHYATEIYKSGLCFEEYLAANSEAEVG